MQNLFQFLQDIISRIAANVGIINGHAQYLMENRVYTVNR